ncbi:DUF1444 family protein [Sessilibacter sp. MAH4]
MTSSSDNQQPNQQAPLIVPRIKNDNFLTYLNSLEGMTESSLPITERIAGDLLLTYAIDIGPSYVMATPLSLKEYNIQRSQLRESALANSIEAIRGAQIGTNEIIYELTAPDNMAACSILFPNLWQHLEKEIGGSIAATFPHRDFVLYARNNADGLKALREILSQMKFDDTHSLSKLIYKPTPTGWEEVID